MRAWQWCFSGVRTVTRTPPIGISRCQNQWDRCNLVPTACLSSRTRPVDRSGASTGVAGRVIGCRMVACDVVARSPAAMRCARWPVAVAIAQVTADRSLVTARRGQARAYVPLASRGHELGMQAGVLDGGQTIRSHHSRAWTIRWRARLRIRHRGSG